MKDANVLDAVARQLVWHGLLVHFCKMEMPAGWQREVHTFLVWGAIFRATRNLVCNDVSPWPLMVRITLGNSLPHTLVGLVLMHTHASC